MGSWDALTAPVGTFFSWGGDDLSKFDYATKLNWEAYNDKNNLKELFRINIIPIPENFTLTTHSSSLAYMKEGQLLVKTMVSEDPRYFHVIFNEP